MGTYDEFRGLYRTQYGVTDPLANTVRLLSHPHSPYPCQPLYQSSLVSSNPYFTCCLFLSTFPCHDFPPLLFAVVAISFVQQ